MQLFLSISEMVNDQANLLNEWRERDENVRGESDLLKLYRKLPLVLSVVDEDLLERSVVGLLPDQPVERPDQDHRINDRAVEVGVDLVKNPERAGCQVD